MNTFTSDSLGCGYSCPTTCGDIGVFESFELHGFWIGDDEVLAPAEPWVNVSI
jgi:hypothetical protein